MFIVYNIQYEYVEGIKLNEKKWRKQQRNEIIIERGGEERKEVLQQVQRRTLIWNFWRGLNMFQH